MAKVLITDCSSGFGLLTALRFARQGDVVYATMRRPDPAPKLRYLVGRTPRYATAYRQLEPEAYEELMRQSLDWQD